MQSSFDTVSKLSSEKLNSLLTAGDAPERVWATWALALKRTKPTMPLEAMKNEPSSGVRLNMVVLVAGAGEKTILEALALNDPDIQVRASACQYISRLSEQNNVCDPFLSSVLLSSDSDQIKQRILREFLLNNIVLPSKVVVSLIRSGNEEIRSLLVSCLLQNSESYELLSMKSVALVPALFAEKEEEIRRQIYSVCRMVSSSVELLTLDPKNEEIMMYLLQKMEQRNEPLLWSDIDSILSECSHDIQLHILSMVYSENKPECVIWALSLTNISRLSDWHEYYNVRNDLLNLLKSYSGITRYSKDAESLVVGITEEKNSIGEPDESDWDPEEELKYLDQLSSAIESWSVKE